MLFNKKELTRPIIGFFCNKVYTLNNLGEIYMKKLLGIATALLIATGVFAQDAKKGPDFTYGARAWVYGVTAGQDEYKADYSHFRIRPMLSLAMEDIKLVTHLEISQYFGRATDAVGYAAPSTDNYAVKVKGAYLEAKNVFMPGLSLMGGLNGYKYPFVVDNDLAMAQVAFDFVMGKANINYFKINEYDRYEKKADGTKQDMDAQAYMLDVPIKVDNDITVRPAVMLIQGGKTAYDSGGGTYPMSDARNYLYKTSLINAALNAVGKVDMIGFTVTGAYLTGTLYKDPDPTGTEEKTKTSAFAFDLGVDVKPNSMFKVGAFFTYLSGDDGKKPGEENNNYYATMESIFGKPGSHDGLGYGRLFILDGGSVLQVGGNYADYYAIEHAQGYMAYGINCEAYLDQLTIFAQFGMASTAEKAANWKGEEKTSIGAEIDFKVSYALASKTSLFAEFAYVLAGDIQFNAQGDTSNDPENMYQVAVGIAAQL